MGSRASHICQSGSIDRGVLRLPGIHESAEIEQLFTSSRAAVLPDMIESWPCRSWDLEWLSSCLGHLDVQVSQKDACGNVISREYLNLGSFLLQHQNADIGAKWGDGTIAYVDNFDVFGLAPELRECVQSERLFGSARALIIHGGFIGPPGSATRMHVDSEDNIISCIFGRKLFVLVPPEAKELIDYSARDIPLENPWDLAVDEAVRCHPMFANCRDDVCIVTLNGGEVLVQPKGWSHWVYNLEFTFSVPCWAKLLPAFE